MYEVEGYCILGTYSPPTKLLTTPTYRFCPYFKDIESNKSIIDSWLLHLDGILDPGRDPGLELALDPDADPGTELGADRESRYTWKLPSQFELAGE